MVFQSLEGKAARGKGVRVEMLVCSGRDSMKNKERRQWQIS